jgi:hypothetical protein
MLVALGVNATTIEVRYSPRTINHRAVMVVTLEMGKSPPADTQLLINDYLDAVKALMAHAQN